MKRSHASVLEAAARRSGALLHQLRRPLSAAVAFAELLGDEVSGPLNEAQQDQVTTILRNLELLDGDLCALHELVAVASGTGAAPPGEVELEELCARIQDDLAREAHEAGVRLYVDSAGPLVLREVDGERLGRALCLLARRALWDSRRGGSVGLVLSGSAGEVKLDVLDDACFSGAEASQLEAPFAGDEPYDGRGLGVEPYLCRAIVALRGGSVGVVRRPQGGREWRVRIPSLPPEETPAEPQNTSNARRGVQQVRKA